MAVLTYSPSHVDPALLERLTIGASRHHLLGTLVEAVQSEVGRESHQHHLLIGPRGSGKTHILTLTAHRLRSVPELGSRILPLSLAEEVVATHPADLMRRVLMKLSEALDRIDAAGAPAARRGTGAALAALRSEPDDDRALEIAMGALEEASEALGRLLVPVVENLNLLLYSGPGLSRRSETPGQWALRRALLEARGVLLLAASPTLFGEVCDPQAPFYDFFRMHRLEELHPDEMLDLIRARLAVELESDSLEASHRARLQTLSDGFEERTPKLRGLLTLTGGLPRFAHLLFDLLAETDVPRIVDLLARFLDKQTPYFQPYLDPRMHPEAELEVLDRLASAEGPLMRREIAAGLRAGSMNAISVYLKRLQGKGLVRQLGTSRKDIRYDLTEPLFRVWRRFRLGRSEREQVVLIAEFIAAMFEPSQLQSEWSQLEGVATAGFRRQVLETALERQGWPVALQPQAPAQEKGSKASAVLKKARREYQYGSPPKAYELFSQAVKELRAKGDKRELSRVLIEFSLAALAADHLEHSLALVTEAEEQAGDIGEALDRANAIRNRAYVLSQLDQDKDALRDLAEAETLYKKLNHDLGRASTLRSRGNIFYDLGQYQDALQAFSEAKSLYQKLGNDVGQANALRRQGEILSRLGHPQEALQALSEAETIYQRLERSLGQAKVLRSRGAILFQLGKTQGAFQALSDAEALYPKIDNEFGRAKELHIHGETLLSLGQKKEAFKAINAAEALFQKLKNDLGIAGCQWSYGRIASADARFEEGMGHLATAYQVARSVSRQRNAKLVLPEVWKLLIRACYELAPNKFRQVLNKVVPLLQHASDDESVRNGLVGYALVVLVLFGPKHFLEMLPVLEAGLPALQATLLRPARLAAEIQAGQRSAELPEETDEMRRAVLQVQERAEELREASSSPSDGRSSGIASASSIKPSKASVKKRSSSRKERKKKS